MATLLHGRDLTHYSEWTTEFPTIENYYEQYRYGDYAHDVAIDRWDDRRMTGHSTHPGVDHDWSPTTSGHVSLPVNPVSRWLGRRQSIHIARHCQRGATTQIH
ncbi:hypothetical protein GCM10009067_39650 [Haloarcula sebkhae]|uniref:Uncharacterized protein n=1 Tax=Haloarcula sebkhae TaxID=932660 RepID=A0A830F7I5_9EURY|nr:hypothetical protein GCM10009067_39650 [Haloarcula sebkhae]